MMRGIRRLYGETRHKATLVSFTHLMISWLAFDGFSMLHQQSWCQQLRDCTGDMTIVTLVSLSPGPFFPGSHEMTLSVRRHDPCRCRQQSKGYMVRSDKALLSSPWLCSCPNCDFLQRLSFACFPVKFEDNLCDAVADFYADPES